MPIEVKNISHIYMENTPYEKKALNNVSLTINEGEFVAIAGHTGSGKSTLMQHFNGLLNPTRGEVFIDGIDINKKKDKKTLNARRSVGMVFQYPEQQLFEESIFADIAFGPRNFGCSEDEVKQRVKEAMDFVELDYEEYKDKSPFLLSGGQMRRVAIAGIIALKPKYLVLDEPTAGLDPRLKQNLLQKVKKLHQKEKMTIIMVSHNMDDIALLADKVAIMRQGKLMIYGEPREVFTHKDVIEQAGLLEPEVMQLLRKIQEYGLDVDINALNKQEALNNILVALKERDKMLTDIKIGQFFPANSLLHKLDARLKIVSLFILIVGIFVFDSQLDYIIWCVLIGSLMYMSKIPLKMFFISIKPIIWIILFTFILHLFTTQGKVIFEVWKLSITWEGLANGSFVCLRLLLLMFGASLLTFTTPPLVLSDALEDLMKPLKRFGVPAHELAMMMTIALRFIPTLLEETDKIIKAQKSRGADFMTGNILKRVKAFMPILIPLFISAFRRADDLAMAMEARCYHGGVGRTRLKQLSFASRDYIAMTAFIGILLILTVIKIVFPHIVLFTL